MQNNLFPLDYLSSRQRFRSWEKTISLSWPDTRLVSYPIGSPADNLSIDVLQSNAGKKNDHLIVLTTGLHGIEGYAGSAMMEFFLQNFLSRLNPETTGFYLVHTINPWGMKNNQRTNQNNVDLNRNFLYDAQDFSSDNPGYAHFKDFFAPERTVHSVFLPSFYARLISLVVCGKKTLFKQALLSGQYEYPKGLYYGGKEIQAETCLMMKLFQDCFSLSKHIVHIDIHTGYGPRYQMSLVHSPFADIASSEYMMQSGYPRVLQANDAEFYQMKGDMVNYLYILKEKEYPEAQLYSSCFEFGCYGESILAEAKALWCLIFNNQMRHYGADKNSASKIQNLWKEAFFPSEPAWREKAISDFSLACTCVLQKQGLI